MFGRNVDFAEARAVAAVRRVTETILVAKLILDLAVNVVERLFLGAFEVSAAGVVGELNVYSIENTQSGYTIATANRHSMTATQPMTILGRHCESRNEIGRDVALPADLHAGDLLAVACTGAYHHSMGSTHNMVGRSPLVAVKDGLARELVRRETIAIAADLKSRAKPLVAMIDGALARSG